VAAGGNRHNVGDVYRTTPAGAGTPALQWTIHLARRRPAKTTAALAIAAAGAVCAGVGFGSVWVGALAAGLLMAAISDFLFPIRYRMTEEGAEARGLVMRRRMGWSAVKRVVSDELGVKLSPLARPSRLEAYRGIYCWFADNADEVMEFIARHTEAVGGDDRRSAGSLPRGS